MLKRLFTYLMSLRIVSKSNSKPDIVIDEIKHESDIFDMYKHPNFNNRVLDMVKLLDSEQYYLVTHPDKQTAARMLEEADYQFFIFNYLDMEACQYAYIFWTNMTSTHARDIADEVIEWKSAQEDINWEIRKILQ